MQHDMEDLKQIMSNWYFNYCDLQRPFQPPKISWKNIGLEFIYHDFIDFLQKDNMYVLNGIPKKLNMTYPFFFENKPDKQMYVWNVDTFKYEPISKKFDTMGNYHFLYIKKVLNGKIIHFKEYSLKSVSFPIIKNRRYKMQTKVFENLGIAVLYSHAMPFLPSFSFLGVQTYGHMIICPIAKNTNTEIAKDTKHFLIDKRVIKNMVVS